VFVRIEEKPGFNAVGMKYRGRNEKNEVPELWESFVPRMGEVQKRTDMTTSYGVMDNFDSESGEFDYIACVEVTSSEELPEGMVVIKVPEQTYAVFKTPLPRIKETFGQIYREWLPESDHKRTSGPEFELYGKEFDLAQTIFIYIPIKAD
jgi:AraC family transcriptional regulator